MIQYQVILVVQLYLNPRIFGEYNDIPSLPYLGLRNRHNLGRLWFLLGGCKGNTMPEGLLSSRSTS